MTYVLGCRLDDIDASEAVRRIVTYARGNEPAQVVTLGTEMVVHAQRDEPFRATVNAAALSLCDTVGLLWAARRHGARLRARVAGVDLVERLCDAAAREGLGVYFFGGARGVADAAAARLRERYPALLVSGARDGYFDEAQSVQIASEIRASGARLLLCGLGFPRQEFWLASHLAQTRCGAGIGVGGSFDVLSQRVRRAPSAWRSLGLEWLYRLISEPRRWRRQLALPVFAGLVMCELLGLRKTAPP